MAFCSRWKYTKGNEQDSRHFKLYFCRIFYDTHFFRCKNAFHRIKTETKKIFFITFLWDTATQLKLFLHTQIHQVVINFFLLWLPMNYWKLRGAFIYQNKRDFKVGDPLYDDKRTLLEAREKFSAKEKESRKYRQKKREREMFWLSFTLSYIQRHLIKSVLSITQCKYVKVIQSLQLICNPKLTANIDKFLLIVASPCKEYLVWFNS